MSLTHLVSKTSIFHVTRLISEISDTHSKRNLASLRAFYQSNKKRNFENFPIKMSKTIIYFIYSSSVIVTEFYFHNRIWYFINHIGVISFVNYNWNSMSALFDTYIRIISVKIFIFTHLIASQHRSMFKIVMGEGKWAQATFWAHELKISSFYCPRCSLFFNNKKKMFSWIHFWYDYNKLWITKFMIWKYCDESKIRNTFSVSTKDVFLLQKSCPYYWRCSQYFLFWFVVFRGVCSRPENE